MCVVTGFMHREKLGNLLKKKTKKLIRDQNKNKKNKVISLILINNTYFIMYFVVFKERKPFDYNSLRSLP